LGDDFWWVLNILIMWGSYEITPWTSDGAGRRSNVLQPHQTLFMKLCPATASSSSFFFLFLPNNLFNSVSCTVSRINFFQKIREKVRKGEEKVGVRETTYALYVIPFFMFEKNFKKITKIYLYQISYI
jgi:hypothetical protein